MVLRTLLYDVMSYDKQALDIVNSKNNGKIKSERGYHYKDLSYNDKLSPVITLVVYFSHKKWSGHKRFIDMVNVSSPAMREYIIDYKLNIIEPNFMTDDDFNKFKTEIGLVLESVKYSNNKNMFLTTIQNKMNYKNMNIDTADFIKSVVNLDIEYEEKNGKINMCKALDDLKKDWKAEGKAEGKTEGINQSIQALHSNGIEENAIAKLLCLDIQYVRDVLAK